MLEDMVRVWMEAGSGLMLLLNFVRWKNKQMVHNLEKSCEFLITGDQVGLPAEFRSNYG